MIPIPSLFSILIPMPLLLDSDLGSAHDFDGGRRSWNNFDDLIRNDGRRSMGKLRLARAHSGWGLEWNRSSLRARELRKSRWSPLPRDTCNPKGVTSRLLGKNRIPDAEESRLVEEEEDYRWGSGVTGGPPEHSLTGRNSTAKAATLLP
ncbi:hypothetical protein EVAR_64258_1 [Eumeta japonica]|uniref:Secreted protein n=1 Tax=Eumeta variegata TaxID=151549 RepID=A0A4C1YTH2_EUMVA|nr:hypothetical protein EVAR_64258_1 [Eumeta japonica]